MRADLLADALQVVAKPALKVIMRVRTRVWGIVRARDRARASARVRVRAWASFRTQASRARLCRIPSPCHLINPDLNV